MQFVGQERKLKRVVIDTNALISSLLFKGPSNKLVYLWQKKKFVFLISKQILGEYIRVLNYPKFHLNEEEIEEIIKEELLPFVQVVTVKKFVSIIKVDPADNIFLSTALTGRAKFIVSGDRHLLKLREYQGIRILKIKDFYLKINYG